MTTREEAIELLNNTHEFPCAVMVKAIGSNQDDFAGRVLALAMQQLRLAEQPEFTVRETRGGRHIAITFEPTFIDAELVLEFYEQLRRVEGIVLLM